MRIFRRIKRRFALPSKRPPEDERIAVPLPDGGETVSIETALNSRCSSDYDGDPELFHWGMFDPAKKLSPEQVNRIVDMVSVPRFTNSRLEIRVDDSVVTFIVESSGSAGEREWMMVECGMQQQSVALACAALGVGTVFESLGVGVSVSDSDYAAIKMRLEPMKPSYGGSYWSSSEPQGRRPWLKGNLSDPVREGAKSLIAAFDSLHVANLAGRVATDEDVSQLLWSARGRTPHFYRAKPWGLTIPTNLGRQDISSLYLLSGNTIYTYVNWEKRRPTHSIRMYAEGEGMIHSEVRLPDPSLRKTVVLSINEKSNIAFWEIGNQLLNLFIQAYGLDIRCAGMLLDEKQTSIFTPLGIRHPVAVFSV